MKDELVIVIDLDGTLKTEAGENGPFESDSITIKSGEKEYTFAKRPHVDTFLGEASKKGKLYLGTAGGRGYARNVLKALGIEHYFSRVITAEDFGRGNVPFLKNCIFIDNDDEMGRLKMDKMPTSYHPDIRQDLWVIDTFEGNLDDTTMLELVEEMKDL